MHFPTFGASFVAAELESDSARRFVVSRRRVDLPDETTRAKILEAQLSRKPWKRFDL